MKWSRHEHGHHGGHGRAGYHHGNLREALIEAALSLMDQRTEAVLNALGNIYDVVLIHAGEASSRTTLLIVKCQAALVLAPDLRQEDVAKTAKSLLVSGLADVQFIRLEQVKSAENRLAASA